MKKSKTEYLIPLIILPLIVMAFPCNASTSVGPEMINNNSFENWTGSILDNWYWFEESGDTSDIILEKETNLFYEGLYSLKVTLTSENSTIRYLVQTFPAEPDIPYAISLYIYDNDSLGRIYARYEYLDASDNNVGLGMSSLITDENSWRDAVGGISTPTNPATTQLRFMIGFVSTATDRNVTFYVDYASVKNNSIPELSNINSIFFLSTITLLATRIFRKFKK